MPEGPKVVVPDGRRCQLYYFTGKVLSSQKQKETQISSGSQYNAGSGHTVATVSSRTVDHHEFFLADASGTERAFKTVNFDFPCRDGQTMSVMWSIAEGKNEGPFLAVRNHNTGERHDASQASVAEWMKEPYSWAVIGIAVAIAIVLSFISGGLAFLYVVGIAIYGWWRKRSRANSAAKELLNGAGLRQLDSQLAPLKALAA